MHRPLSAAILARDPTVLRTIAWQPIPLRPSALVPRPWGGRRLPGLRGLPPEGGPFGEAFEVSAFPADPEARAHPSIARLPDGSELPLPALLEAAGVELLGAAHLARHGPVLPWLPKTLDVAALLSVQIHPPGQPELYVVLEADPGATLRLGLRESVDPEVLRAEAARGRALQDRLAQALASGVDEAALEARLGGWLVAEGARPLPDLAGLFVAGFDPGAPLHELRQVCRAWLARMHSVPLTPGAIIANRRLRAGVPSADLHALGDPEGRTALLLEVRLPGPTWRAWDHGRFPRRPLELALALSDLPPVAPADFYEVAPRPIADRPGADLVVAWPDVRIERLHPAPHLDLARPAAPSILLGVRGEACLEGVHGHPVARITAGQAILLPEGVQPLRLRAPPGAEVLHLLPPSPPPAPGIPASPTAPLRFGTSGLRGLVRDMTDRELSLATLGFLDHLRARGELAPGDPVALGEDLRARCAVTGLESSPRIARAVAAACATLGHPVVHGGRLPTPALAYWAGLDDSAHGKRPMPAIMVTGSHIPADRNGVKFYRAGAEILKDDEPGILAAIAARRAAGEPTPILVAIPSDTPAMARAYVRRYLEAFGRPLAGLRLVLYQHSAVGRDLLLEIFSGLGAETIPVGRTDDFVPIDTEDLALADLARLGALVREYAADALISTDGDSDRPLLLDERGRFHPGDLLGLVAALHLGATFAAVPVSTSDAVDLHLAAVGGPTLEKTRIGSPWVIAAMERARARGEHAVVGWEANGGFLLGSDLALPRGVLRALPTRDAVLPLVCALREATGRGVPLSAVFDALPSRANGAALLDGVPPERAQALIARLAAGDPSAEFARVPGLGIVLAMDLTDGLRMSFQSGEILHLRPSGNAPQLRCYAVSGSRARTAELLDRALTGPDSLVRGWLGAGPTPVF
jgi:phosphomannomutase